MRGIGEWALRDDFLGAVGAVVLITRVSDVEIFLLSLRSRSWAFVLADTRRHRFIISRSARIILSLKVPQCMLIS